MTTDLFHRYIVKLIITYSTTRVNMPQTVGQSEESKSSVRATVPEATGALSNDNVVAL